VVPPAAVAWTALVTRAGEIVFDHGAEGANPPRNLSGKRTATGRQL
jgi:hypothetical protein